jgi:2-polyprenyl-6-methoxyphenol hydroxylase-like FAD-dependent oxidoreductase
MITKYRWTANTPRAHITNQRAMEIFRDLGIEDQVLADATPHELVGDTVFCTSIAGEEIGRIRTWGTHPAREADYQLASPCLICDIPQTYLEPILVKNAAARGTQARFSTEYLSLAQDDDGVDVKVRDRLTGAVYTIRAKYLIGADGARSKVAEDIGLPMEGAMDIAGSMNITFKADISAARADPPVVLYWVIQPGSDVGGIGAGLVRMIRPWNEWLIVWGYDISQPAPVIDDAGRHQIVRNLLGLPDLDVEITGTSCGATTRCTRPTCSRAARSAPGTPSTAIRRATASAPTRPCRTPTTSPGSSRPCCAARRARDCSRPTRPSAPPLRSRSCCGPTEQPRVRPVLRGARADRRRDRRGDAPADRGAQGQHPAGRGEASGPCSGDGA